MLNFGGVNRHNTPPNQTQLQLASHLQVVGSKPRPSVEGDFSKKVGGEKKNAMEQQRGL